MSSILPVSTSSIDPLYLSRRDDNRQPFPQLMKSVRSGDLSGAQQARVALTQAQLDSGTQPDLNDSLGVDGVAAFLWIQSRVAFVPLPARCVVGGGPL
jgi:hypothetical protein